MATLPMISLIVTEQLYSSLGNVLCTTIPVVKGSDNLLGFVDTLVSVRNPLDSNSQWCTGGPFDTDSDVVSWAWANNAAISDTDRQYAYQGKFPEADPLLRKTQSSQPGQDFSIEGETGSANHSVSYTPGYLPSVIDDTLPSLLLGEQGTTASLYTQLLCKGEQRSLGNLGNIYRASMTDFQGNILAKVSMDDNKHVLLSTSVYQFGAALNSDAGSAYMRETQTYLPNYYSLSDSGQSITTQANALKQNISQHSPDSNTHLNYYDVYGRLRFSQTADQAHVGTVVYYLYDALNRLIESGFISMAWDVNTFEGLTLQPDATQLSSSVSSNTLRCWEYDQAENTSNYLLETIGQIIQITSWNTMFNSDNKVIVNPNTQFTEQYTYDYLGRCEKDIKTLSSGSPYTTAYRYDSLNRISTLTYPQVPSSTTDFTVYYSYNLQAQLSALGTADNLFSYGTYQYNEFQEVIQENLGENGQQVNYTYGNSLGQLTAYSDTYQLMSATLSYTDSNNYYQDGNIQSVNYIFDVDTLTVNGASIQSYGYSYTYDAFNRLVAANAQNSDSVSSMTNLTFDTNNNIQTYTLNDVAYTYNYNPGTNQIKNINGGTKFTYSDSGKTLTTPDNLSLTYDLLIALPVALSTPDDNVTLIYDSSGERYQKNSTNTTITYLRATNSRPLLEVVYDTVNEVTTTLYYVYGPKGLAIMSDGLTNYVVLKDHQSSVRIVHEDIAVTDLSSANIAGYFNYLPYGSLMNNNTQQNSNLLACRYLYTGQEWDGELGLYNYHARQYDPNLGQFYTLDPAHQYASPYVYVSNNPINFIDQTGQVIQIGDAAYFRTSEIMAHFVQTQKTVLVAEVQVGDWIDGVDTQRFRAENEEGSDAEIHFLNRVWVEIPDNQYVNIDIIMNQSPCESCAEAILSFLEKYPQVSMTIQFAKAACGGSLETAMRRLEKLAELAQRGVKFNTIDVAGELEDMFGLSIMDVVYDRYIRAENPSRNQIDNWVAYLEGEYNATDKVAEDARNANTWVDAIYEMIGRDRPEAPLSDMTFGQIVAADDVIRVPDDIAADIHGL